MTIEELSRRFGAPGRIVFRQGHGGWPEVAIANKFGVAEIALLGANVLSYRPTGHSQVLFRPAKRDYNRGETLHGGIPVCWPQFGRLAIEGMGAHGFARIMPFEVRATQYTEDMTEVTLGLKSGPETRKLWPHDFDLEAKISVSMKLNLSLTTRNTGTEPLSFSAGFHPYLLVRERDATTLRGLDGEPYVYAVDMSERVQTGDLAMDRAADHVFSLKPAPKHELALIDPGLKRAIAVVSAGNSKAVVWNPGPDGTPSDCGPEDWRRFVCVEPVTDWPGTGEPLEPGGKRTLSAAIQSVAEEAR